MATEEDIAWLVKTGQITDTPTKKTETKKDEE